MNQDVQEEQMPGFSRMTKMTLDTCDRILGINNTNVVKKDTQKMIIMLLMKVYQYVHDCCVKT